MTHGLLVNYNHDPKDWWLDYGLTDMIILDRSDDGVERTFAARTYKTSNVGDVDFDKLSWLVENYNNLPDVFLWGKSNLFKYCEPEYLKEKLEKGEFAPLLKFDHKTYSDKFGEVCRYAGPIYEERADSWFFNNPRLSNGNFRTWGEWANHFLLPLRGFIPFSPGGNYILTKERVHRYSKEFYEEMRDMLPYAQHPAEAHACERSYYLLWK